MNEHRVWIQVPTLDGQSAATRTKYPIDANALIIYRGDSAYVRFANAASGETIARHGDVRVLDDREVRRFEQSLPFLPPPQDDEAHGQARRALRLGDAVSSLTRRLGIRECSGCQRRRSLLNRIVLWRW